MSCDGREEERKKGGWEENLGRRGKRRMSGSAPLDFEVSARGLGLSGKCGKEWMVVKNLVGYSAVLMVLR